MLRTLFVGSICLTSLLCFTPTAEACGETGCQALLAMIQVDSVEPDDANPEPPSLAEEGDEASVRERDLSKRQPKAPAFWSQFRSYAYKQLPTHREESFTAVWVGMPLATSDGTVPALGVRGSWW